MSGGAQGRSTTVVRWRSAVAPVGMLLWALTSPGCGTDPSCDQVCDNVLDKCGGRGDEVAANLCLEECAQQVQDVPSSCAAERDAVLVCLADAESLDCGDPLRSAACTAQVDAVAACSTVEPAGSTGSASGGSGSGGGGGTDGPACDGDDDCPGALCNLQVQQCRAPGALGDPCFRDEECGDGLCNAQISACAEPGALGDPCFTDDECASASCDDSRCA